MLFIVAWRNIWRNRARSLVIFMAIVVGLVAGVVVSAVFNGLLKTTFEESIQNRISHIQIHHPEFLQNREIRYEIPNIEDVQQTLDIHSQIQVYSTRTVVEGMVASSRMSAGVRMMGIDPEMEARTTHFDELIVEGSYFEERGRLPQVIIGESLAEKLKVNVRSRIVLTFQDARGELISASFTVTAIFKATQSHFEERTVFMRGDELRQIAGSENGITEIALLLEDFNDYKTVQGELAASFPELRVRHWEEIAPDLYLQLETSAQTLIWIVFIILLGVAFGLLNTVLMSVFERIRELGMLMAIGMKKAHVFTLIMLETILLSLSGGAVGLVVSVLLVRLLNNKGIDMANFGNADSFSEFGMSTLSYPYLDTGYYIQVAVLVFILAILAAIYPALKAIRLVPAEAVRQE